MHLGGAPTVLVAMAGITTGGDCRPSIQNSLVYGTAIDWLYGRISKTLPLGPNSSTVMSMICVQAAFKVLHNRTPCGKILTCNAGNIPKVQIAVVTDEDLNRTLQFLLHKFTVKVPVKRLDETETITLRCPWR